MPEQSRGIGSSWKPRSAGSLPASLGASKKHPLVSPRSPQSTKPASSIAHIFLRCEVMEEFEGQLRGAVAKLCASPQSPQSHNEANEEPEQELGPRNVWEWARPTVEPTVELCWGYVGAMLGLCWGYVVLPSLTHIKPPCQVRDARPRGSHPSREEGLRHLAGRAC